MENSRVIDLRKSAKITNNTPAAVLTLEEKNPESSTFEWTALEYEKIEHGQYWFIGMGAAAVFLIIIGIFAKSYFFIAFIILAYIVVALYAKREPRELLFSITPEGIKIGSAFHKFSDLKSFWILDREDGKYLSIETTKVLSPFLRIPLGNTDPKMVKKIVSRFLQEKEHEELLTDQIAKIIGF